MNNLIKIITASLTKRAPFRSPKQEQWMWINKPEMAKKWKKEHGDHPDWKAYNKKRKKKATLDC